jgi:hypothetical protein
MSNIITSEKPLKVKEVSHIPTCCLCSEQASIYVEGSVFPFLCGIPGNHPGYDEDEGVPLQIVSAE